MTILEYLVPSKARRELLRILYLNRKSFPILELSRMLNLPYSSVHREMEGMRELGLVRGERAGKALRCSWDPTSSAAKALMPLLSQLSKGEAGEPSEDHLYWNLRRFGAPLANVGTQGKTLTLEETLAYALKLARHRPDVTRIWPVVFAKHRAGIKLDLLMRLSSRLGQKRALGFFLALTRELLQDGSLQAAERALQDRRYKSTQDFFLDERSELARTLADMRTPMAAKKWRFRMNMPMDIFKSSFEKFAPKP